MMSWKKRYLSFSEEEESPARKSANVSVGQQVIIPHRCEVPANSGSVSGGVAPPIPTPPPAPHVKYQEPSPLHHPYWGVPGRGAGAGHCGQTEMMQQQVQLMYRQWGWSHGPGIPVFPAPPSTDLTIRPSFIGPGNPSRPRSSGMDQSLDLSVRTQVKLETPVSSEKQQPGQPVECSKAVAAVIKSESQLSAFPPPEPDTVQNEFRAALKNGVLVPDQAGPLVVTHFVIEQKEEGELKNTCETEMLMKSEKSDDRISGRSTVIKMLESIDGHEKGKFEPKTRNLGIQCSHPGPGHMLQSLAEIQTEKVQKIVKYSEKATVPKEIEIQLEKVQKIVKHSEKATVSKEIESPETRNRRDGGCVDEANVSNPMIELALADREADLVSSIHQKMEESKKAMVLWHFLWNLLKVDTDALVIRWTDEERKKFQIVDTAQLARLWARMKNNPAIGWTTLQKVLELYVRKNFIRVSHSGLLLEYIFTMDQQNSER